MATMSWSDDLSVGIEAIDQEHRTLIGLINESYGVLAEQNRLLMHDILSELLDYIDVHFGHEEEVMKAVGYPGLERHVNEHRVLAQQAMNYIAMMRTGKAFVLGREFTDFMRDWLVKHIKVSDMEYGSYIKSRA